MVWSMVFCVKGEVELWLSNTQDIPDAQDYTNHQHMPGVPAVTLFFADWGEGRDRHSSDSLKEGLQATKF